MFEASSIYFAEHKRQLCIDGYTIKAVKTAANDQLR